MALGEKLVPVMSVIDKDVLVVVLVNCWRWVELGRVCGVPLALMVNMVVWLFWMGGRTWVRMVLQLGVVAAGTGELEP